MTDTQKTQTTPQGAVSVISDRSLAFNPLNTLNDEQRTVIAARFNNTWQRPRQTEIKELQKKYGLDFFTAAFTLGLQEDATNLLSNKKVSQASERMFELSSELFGTAENIAAALRDIETVYDRLDEIQQRTAGIKFRTSVVKGHTHKMAGRILEMVTEALGIKEIEWVASK